MSRALAIFLLCLYAAHTFCDVLIVTDYLINKSYIAENLCINRDKPKMHCDGKCVLMQKLSRSNEKDKKPPLERFMDKLELKVVISSLFHLQRAGNANAGKDFHTRDEDLYVSDVFSGIFHPPEVRIV